MLKILLLFIFILTFLVPRILSKDGRFMKERVGYKKYLTKCKHLSNKEVDDVFYNKIIKPELTGKDHTNFLTPEFNGDLCYWIHFEDSPCSAIDTFDGGNGWHTICKAHWEGKYFDTFKRVMVGDWIIGIERDKRRRDQKERLRQINKDLSVR